MRSGVKDLVGRGPGPAGVWHGRNAKLEGFCKRFSIKS